MSNENEVKVEEKVVAPAKKAVSKTVAAKPKATVSKAVKKPAAAVKKVAAKTKAPAKKAVAKKVVSKKTVAKKVALKPVVKPLKTVVKPLKTVVKPLVQPAAKPIVEHKIKKSKLVRDSFTMPEVEYQVLSDVKKAFLKAGVSVKKSELLRAGVVLIKNMDLSKLNAVIAALAPLKAGRPKKDK